MSLCSYNERKSDTKVINNNYCFQLVQQTLTLTHTHLMKIVTARSVGDKNRRKCVAFEHPLLFCVCQLQLHNSHNVDFLERKAVKTWKKCLPDTQHFQLNVSLFFVAILCYHVWP